MVEHIVYDKVTVINVIYPKTTPARGVTGRLLYCLEIDSCSNEDILSLILI